MLGEVLWLSKCYLSTTYSIGNQPALLCISPSKTLTFLNPIALSISRAFVPTGTPITPSFVINSRRPCQSLAISVFVTCPEISLVGARGISCLGSVLSGSLKNASFPSSLTCCGFVAVGVWVGLGVEVTAAVGFGVGVGVTFAAVVGFGVACDVGEGEGFGVGVGVGVEVGVRLAASCPSS